MVGVGPRSTLTHARKKFDIFA